ncbi:OSM2 [Candida jiufengensis]|uniref:OSM2 n=1 Tax=Candida jiufengensis TaxID=497108 RepID=UPI002224F97B|nr:OSM2 [Candida jiufengensis]KAI5954249.1 OSM2 [Candida jiufengensis]
MSESPLNPIIIVGGGLAGLSAAHQAYLRGANVILLDKQGFLSGNSGKATSGINGALTRTQVQLDIKDSVEQFYADTLKTAKDRANPDLIKVLTYNSADAIHWLQEIFNLDLSVVSRLGGHSQPRTHRGHDSKFPGMAITYRLLETLEKLSEDEPNRVQILKNCQVIDLLKEGDDKVIGVKYKNLKDKSKFEMYGPVIMSTGGYAADFTKNSLLRKYRPDIIDLPSTNGVHATGDGQKIIMKNNGVGIDMDKVQVHPTGLIDYNDKDVIEGKTQPRFLFLGAEALRGEGGIMLNGKGERFVDELGTRDWVSGEMEKQNNMGNGPIRLVLSEESEKNLSFHIKHYTDRKLMRTVTGKQLCEEIGCSEETLKQQLDTYNKAASGEIKDPYGKKFFPTTPFVYNPDAKYHVSFITRVLHFTMGGVKINDKSQVLTVDDKPFEGLYAAGEVAGGVHGHNRLGGSSLLACVVYGRLAADEASSYSFQKLSSQPASKIEQQQQITAAPVDSSDQPATQRLNMISLHIDPNSKRIIIDLNDNSNSNASFQQPQQQQQITQAQPQTQPQSQPQSQPPQKQASKKPTAFTIPNKEFSLEEIAKHNTASDCWCIIKNVVVDLTSFLNDHPGGSQSIVNFGGRDATESFGMLHEDNFIPKYVPDSVLGVVKGTSSELDL